MSAGTVITDTAQLTPGWYAVAFTRELEDGPDWGGAQILQYHGEGYWSDDSGEEVERLWDPVLQNWVATDAADAYARQS